MFFGEKRERDWGRLSCFIPYFLLILLRLSSSEPKLCAMLILFSGKLFPLVGVSIGENVLKILVLIVL